MRPMLRAFLLTVVAAVLLSSGFGTPAAAQKPVVRLELSQQFYYAGEPLEVKVSVGNPGDKKIDNPIRQPLLTSFKVRKDETVLEAKGEPGTEEPNRPDKLTPQSFYGATVNLVDIYPQLAEVGRYEIYWSANELVSQLLMVTVIPKYDPAKDYSAEIETNYGNITIDFYGSESPLAVKAFIDMANAGFYDGLLFHEVQGNSYIIGGDPKFATPPRRAINYPAEQSALPLVAGTVVMRPVRAAPPANGSTFVIVLRPQPAWTGQVTVVGQVSKGIDVVQEISKVPSTQRSSQPNFKPLKDVLIRGIRVTERGRGGAPS